jgi:exosortase/archaeosortase family protein
MAFSKLLIGLCVPGGKIESEFFEEYFNVVHGLQNGLLGLSQLVLQLAGFNTYVQDSKIGIIDNEHVILAHGCFGFEMMAAWIALVLAYPSTWKTQLLAVFVGTTAIQLVNVTRISLMVYFHTYVDDYQSLPFDHHDFFNFFSVLFILVFYYVYLRIKEH